MGLQIREMLYEKIKMNKIMSRITGKTEEQVIFPHPLLTSMVTENCVVLIAVSCRSTRTQSLTTS
jgi:hypothetical protein